MKNSITFKNQPKQTGLAAIGNPYADIDIKCNKKVFGMIVAPNWRSQNKNQWRITITVKEENNSEKWKWATFKQIFNNADDAKKWIKENYEKISEKTQIHFFED